MNKKWLIYVIVILLVIGICFLFITVFNFEGNKENETEIPEPTENLISQLYKCLPENEMNYQTMYTGNYVRLHNISNSIIESMIYNYLKSFNNSKLETTSIEEMQAAGVIATNDNINDITPLSKVKVEVFKDTYPLLFGSSKELTVENFRYNYNTEAVVDGNSEYYYFYENTPLENNDNEIIFKDIVRYVVTENNQTIEIYDYYLKCDLNNNNCYNDERKEDINNTIKYNANLNIDNYIDNLTTYKHTFKYEDGYYYWYSSELA